VHDPLLDRDEAGFDGLGEIVYVVLIDDPVIELGYRAGTCRV
jgi:hypothetical protein